jgi:hypothetical protein
MWYKMNYRYNRSERKHAEDKKCCMHIERMGGQKLPKKLI